MGSTTKTFLAIDKLKLLGKAIQAKDIALAHEIIQSTPNIHLHIIKRTKFREPDERENPYKIILFIKEEKSSKGDLKCRFEFSSSEALINSSYLKYPVNLKAKSIELSHYQQELEAIPIQLKLMPCLEYLKISQHKIIREIRELDNLNALKGLWLQWNQIEEVQLINSPNLEILNLSGNKITSIKGLFGLKHLKSLDLSHNNISDIRGIEKFENLEYLNLYGNQITDLGKLCLLKKLKIIKLGNNPIRTIENKDFSLILKEISAETRKNLIELAGIENVLKSLEAKILDKKENYTLLNFQLELLDWDNIILLDKTEHWRVEYPPKVDEKFGKQYRPYLKMRNPSTGEWHIEGVHPDCKTVNEALAWRDGENIYQKPDVFT